MIMGLTYVEIGISNPADPDGERRVEALVDTGATLSVIPRDILEALGVGSIGKNRFKGFGGVVSREVANVLMRYRDSVAGVTVVIGEGNDPAIMGVTALESLGYQVDPVTGKLNPSEMLLLRL
jgi:predicted aspartyl protease